MRRSPTISCRNAQLVDSELLVVSNFQREKRPWPFHQTLWPLLAASKPWRWRKFDEKFWSILNSDRRIQNQVKLHLVSTFQLQVSKLPNGCTQHILGLLSLAFEFVVGFFQHPGSGRYWTLAAFHVMTRRWRKIEIRTLTTSKMRRSRSPTSKLFAIWIKNIMDVLGLQSWDSLSFVGLGKPYFHSFGRNIS